MPQRKTAHQRAQARKERISELPNAKHPKIDLTDREDILFHLLDTQAEWRERAIERITYSSALFADRQRIISVQPLRHVLGDLIRPDWESARVRLPIAMFPRQLLFELDLTVNEKKVSRLSAEESLNILLRYMDALFWRIVEVVDHAGSENRYIEDSLLDPAIWETITAICMFDSQVWQQEAPGRHRLLNYLQKGLCPIDAAHGTIITDRLGAEVLARWNNQAVDIRKVVQEYTRNDQNSPSCNPLLILPDLKENGVIQDIDQDVPELLHRFNQFIKRIHHLARNSDVYEIRKTARRACSNYALMGRYWMTFADCLVPLDEPFQIAISETRSIEPHSHRGIGKSVLSSISLCRDDLGPFATFRDARSNHLSVRLGDPAVQLGKRPQILTEQGTKPRVEPVVGEREGELILAYSRNPERPRVINVKISLKPALAIRWIHWAVAMIVILTIAALLAAWLGTLHILRAAHVAFLLTPSTFATSLLLAREASALSGLLARNLRVCLAVVLIGLWGLTGYLYLTDRIHVDPPKKPAPSPSITGARQIFR